MTRPKKTAQRTAPAKVVCTMRAKSPLVRRLADAWYNAVAFAVFVGLMAAWGRACNVW